MLRTLSASRSQRVNGTAEIASLAAEAAVAAPASAAGIGSLEATEASSRGCPATGLVFMRAAGADTGAGCCGASLASKKAVIAPVEG